MSAVARGVVRVNQLGYGALDDKAAYLMTQGSAAKAVFTVADRHGHRVLSGKVGRDAGEWNGKYQHVYELDLSALKRPGSYRVEVPGVGASPTFEVKAVGLLEGTKDKAVTFFTEQRDGANVLPGSIGRRPAHLTDWAADVYDWPVMSFMVGVGQNSERCPHHQIANILGRELTGAIVNGPNSEDLFADGLGGHLDGMNPCPPDGIDRYAEFTGHGSRYVDDVRSWQASEPADDFAAIAVYALTR